MRPISENGILNTLNHKKIILLKLKTQQTTMFGIN